MHLTLAEVAPAPVIVPVVRRLLVPLAALAGYLFAWGCAFAASYLVRGLFASISGTIGSIPVIGRLIESPFTALEHRLVHWLGDLESRFERQFTQRWDALAAVVTQYARDTQAAAVFDYHLAKRIANLWGNAATGGMIKKSHAAAKHAEAHAAQGVNVATHANHAAHAAVTATAPAVAVPHPQTKVIVRTYPAGRIGARVGVLEGEIAGVLDWTIPGIRAREKTLEGSLGRLWRRVRAERRALGIGAFVGLLVTALGRLGLGWLRCTRVGKTGKRICGMNPGLLDSLLVDTLLLASGFSIVTLAEELFAVEEEIVGFVKQGVHELRNVDVPSAAEAMASGEW